MNFFQRIPIFIFSLLCPCKIHGRENIPKGKTVIVSNHFHACDCGIIAEVYHKDIYFLAKKEIFKNKLVSKIIKSYGGIPIDRDSPDMKSLLAAIRALKDGHKLAIFVEGTRNKTGTNELQPLKGGASVLAVRAKSPIVPMMMSGKLGLFRKIHVMVGKPFELSEFYDVKLTEETTKKIDEIVREKMLEQQKLLFEHIESKKKRGKKK